MQYKILGDTGVEISQIGLGCMSFGSGEDWKITEDKSKEIINYAIDEGINFFDTANVYSDGKSEKILGETIQDYDRKRLFIATKVYGEMDSENPNSQGLSRKSIQHEFKQSLNRLSLETIDLYQIHRWDYNTSIEETLRTLNNLISQEKIRYIGASSMWAHQFLESLYKSKMLGMEGFKTMQNHYNLLYREEEREMLPLCEKKNIGVIPWSPLARGYLTRPHEQIDKTIRGKKDTYAHGYPYFERKGKKINERVQELSEEKDVSMAQIALSWILNKDYVDCPIIGATKIEHVRQAIDAIDISLSQSDIKYLEEPYKPVEISGHQ